MAEARQSFLESTVGRSIRHNRLRAGLTQVQLARAISRSGKFLSEVENGKTRITRHDLERLADAMGIASEKIHEDHQLNSEAAVLDVPCRIRDLHPTGMTITSFSQLVNHLDRSGWLRSAKLWMIGSQPFPEENDLALVEQIASLVATKDVSVRYVFNADRLNQQERAQMETNQGTLDMLPTSLLDALRWSKAMQEYLDPAAGRVVGYAATWPMPPLSHSHALMWVETEDVSWSDVMPLLYCRGVTRTFENPNEAVAFWYHLPRELGSKLLLDLAQRLRTVSRRSPAG